MNINSLKLFNSIKDLPYNERSIIIPFTPEEFNCFKSNEVAKEFWKYEFGGDLYFLYNEIKKFKNKKINEPKFVNINSMRTDFEFFANHPISGNIYLCSEFEPFKYILVENFHHYFMDYKMSIFAELCSNLGAKKVITKKIYIEGVEQKIEMTAENIPTKIGIIDAGIGISEKILSEYSKYLIFEFPKPKHKIKEYETLFTIEEPSWKSLQKIRLEKDVSKYNVQVNINTDININSQLMVKLNKIGINTNFELNKFKKIKYEYEVEFWPKPWFNF